MDFNSQQVLHDFHALKDSLGLSEKIIDKARYIIRNASKKGSARGRNHATIVAAAVYIACRESEAPRPLHDITTIAEVKQKILGRYCRILMNKLYLNLPNIDPSKCIVRLADMIKANERAKQLAAIMVTKIVDKEFLSEKILWLWQHQYSTYAVKRLEII